MIVVHTEEDTTIGISINGAKFRKCMSAQHLGDVVDLTVKFTTPRKADAPSFFAQFAAHRQQLEICHATTKRSDGLGFDVILLASHRGSRARPTKDLGRLTVGGHRGLPAASVSTGSSLLPAQSVRNWEGSQSVASEPSACGARYSTAMSPELALALARPNGWKPKDIKNHIKDLEEPLRRFLSGELRVALLNLRDEVIADAALSRCAALYELDDAELEGRLEQLRGRAHVVLANGSNKKGDGNK